MKEGIAYGNKHICKIEISDPESIKKLARVMAAEPPKEPLSNHPYSDTERIRSETLLRQFISRTGR